MSNPNYVFVLDTNRKPLTPCKPSLARKLLTVGKAKVFRLYPFTIILNKEIVDVPGSLTLKIDPGSKVTGLAILSGCHLIWVAELTHRGQTIKLSLESRRLQIEHIHPKAKGGTNRISNLCLACEPCNIKKGSQDIEVFLKKKPDVLKQIKAQAKRPLKDAAAVNSTRWALFNRLKATNLEINTGSGGLTKFNRTRLCLPKTHFFDAACVGETLGISVLADQPLNIKAIGHGSRQMCRTDKFGFPFRYVPQFKFVKGFQTGDIVKAVVISGKKIGTYTGKVAVRSTGSFNILAKQGLIQGISYKYCQQIHQKDGYNYGY
ncbi:RRXRR domain-containing protein [Limnofasciculus baicalensis]|uniref:HNH endonuclease n=1 Tax=Limnofasciculus baicalensis BBK-W-15 TaxID=2699891 RepID=A0AAE3KP04_9CYAN|nr:RRXRR domain-containing protein [Limnofasciculus baicalensis]MCP2730784.1 HNH endonuclease [Limnofasciculus baicalensis BBK-W-15]